jgi:hypothetical protein
MTLSGQSMVESPDRKGCHSDWGTEVALERKNDSQPVSRQALSLGRSLQNLRTLLDTSSFPSFVAQ